MTVLAGLSSAPIDAPILPAILFYTLASLTALSAIAIVLTEHTVRMAVYLLATLAGVAGLFLMLDAEFIAAVQLVVYAGGTLILIIFSVMLTTRSPLALSKVPVWERVLGSTIGIVLGAAILVAGLASSIPHLREPLSASPGSSQTIGDNQHVANIGSALLSVYLVPFETAGVLLLLVMVGASYLARRTVPKPAASSPAAISPPQIDQHPASGT